MFFISLLLQLTTKVEIHRGGKWAEKSVSVSYSDGSFGRLADEVGGNEADTNAASLCCHPEGRSLICRRTGTAIRLVALTLAYNAKNTTLICQLTETEGDNMTTLHHQQLRHALLSQGDTVILLTLYKSSLWQCIIYKEDEIRLLLWCNTAIWCSRAHNKNLLQWVTIKLFTWWDFKTHLLHTPNIVKL